MTRSNFMTALIVAGTLFAGAAFAASMDPVLGNTLIRTAADGSKMEFRYTADGKVAVKFPDGAVKTGTWKLDGDTLTSVGDADGETHTSNIGGPEHKVGDKWDGKDDAGNPVTLEIVAGQ